MKNLIKTIALSILLAVTFTSCSKSEVTSEEPVDQVISLETESDLYVRAMVLRKGAMLAIEKAEEAALRAELELQKTDKESIDWLRSGYAISADKRVQEIYRDRAKANREAKASEARKEQKQFEDIARDLLKQAEEISKQFN